MKNEIEKSELAEINVSYSPKVKASNRRKVNSSKDADTLFRIIWNPTLELREEFYIVLLNRANKVLGWFCLAQGGLTGTVVDAKLIFSIALKGLACGIIMAHNHPSGNLEPSQADIILTKKLREAGNLLDIMVLDHLILTCDKYYSFADEGLI